VGATSTLEPSLRSTCPAPWFHAGRHSRSARESSSGPPTRRGSNWASSAPPTAAQTGGASVRGLTLPLRLGGLSLLPVSAVALRIEDGSARGANHLGPRARGATHGCKAEARDEAQDSFHRTRPVLGPGASRPRHRCPGAILPWLGTRGTSGSSAPKAGRSGSGPTPSAGTEGHTIMSSDGVMTATNRLPRGRLRLIPHGWPVVHGEGPDVHDRTRGRERRRRPPVSSNGRRLRCRNLCSTACPEATVQRGRQLVTSLGTVELAIESYRGRDSRRADALD